MDKKFPKVGVGVMIQNERGEVLMGLRQGSHGAGEWCCPGGGLEFGESLIDGAKREAREETGLEVSDLRVITIVEEKRYLEISGKYYIVVGFKAGKYSGQPRLAEPDRFKEWRWFSLDNLPEKMLEATELMIKKFKDGKIY